DPLEDLRDHPPEAAELLAEELIGVKLLGELEVGLADRPLVGLRVDLKELVEGHPLEVVVVVGDLALLVLLELDLLGQQRGVELEALEGDGPALGGGMRTEPFLTFGALA